MLFERILKHREIIDNVRRYYRKSRRLWIPKNSRFKHFRFQLFDGGFIKIKDRITNISKLRRLLVKFVPMNVYYSVAYWLNPTILGRRDSSIYKNNFLWSDFVVDIDTPTIEEGKDRVKHIYSILEDLGYEDMSVRFTGRGFHIVIEMWYKSSIEDPIKREMDCLERMKQLTDILQTKGAVFDFPISRDTRRIIKLPYTITKYGTLSEIVNINKIDSFVPKKIFDFSEIGPIKVDVKKLDVRDIADVIKVVRGEYAKA